MTRVRVQVIVLAAQFPVNGSELSSVKAMNMVKSQSSFHCPLDEILDKASAVQVDSNTTQSQFGRVITLNVGGTSYMTSLATLRKYPDSMLATMFSGRHRLVTDKEGRFFIDRNGTNFAHILNFIRDDKLPPLPYTLDVLEEAQYYNIVPLINALSTTCPVASNKIKRLFLDKVPEYDIKVNLLIEKALNAACEQPDRVTKLQVSIFKEDSFESTMIPQVPEERHLYKTEVDHRCKAALTFGPWSATPDVYDLLHCIKEDVAKLGYQLECQCIGICDQRLTGQYYCKRPIYEFKFKWW